MKYPRCCVTSEIFAGAIENNSGLVSIIDRLCDEGYYHRIGVKLIEEKQTSAYVRRKIEKSGMKLLLWIVFQINQEGLDIASADVAHRKKSLERIFEFINMAADTGADCIGFCSGVNKPSEERDQAYQYFIDGLIQIDARLKKNGMHFLLEPLDREAHKRKLIGNTEDTLKIIRALENENIDLRMVWDTAHVALNQDDLFESQRALNSHISHYHLANAVLDPADPLFGDWHMPYGEPGFLTREKAALLWNDFILHHEDHDVYLSVETRPAKGMDIWENERLSRELMDYLDP